MIALLYAGGLRRAELIALDLADYDSETGALTARSGTGKKARIAPAQAHGPKLSEESP
jgi:site-specific recombinase XerD